MWLCIHSKNSSLTSHTRCIIAYSIYVQVVSSVCILKVVVTILVIEKRQTQQETITKDWDMGIIVCIVVTYFSCMCVLDKHEQRTKWFAFFVMDKCKLDLDSIISYAIYFGCS